MALHFVSRPARKRLAAACLEALESRVFLAASFIKDINTSFAASVTDSTSYAALGNFLYFNAVDQTHGDELWRTDGTSTGTTLVKDINPGAGPSYFSNPLVIGSTLY